MDTTREAFAPLGFAEPPYGLHVRNYSAVRVLAQNLALVPPRNVRFDGTGIT